MKRAASLFVAIIWSMPIYASVTVIDIPFTGSACCIGEIGNDFNSYFGQSFIALGRRITHFHFYALDNNSEAFPGPFNFRVLLVEGALNSKGKRKVLFTSAPISVPLIPNNGGQPTTVSVDMSSENLHRGNAYSWVVDAYSARDGILDVGQIMIVSPVDPDRYPDGQAFAKAATGLGLKDDLNSPWIPIHNSDIAFYMAFGPKNPLPVPEPMPLLVILSGLAAVGLSKCRVSLVSR